MNTQRQRDRKTQRDLQKQKQKDIERHTKTETERGTTRIVHSIHTTTVDSYKQNKTKLSAHSRLLLSQKYDACVFQMRRSRDSDNLK